MRNLAIKISGALATVIPFERLHRMNYPVFLPFYHVVSNEKLPYVLNYRYRNTSEFENELDFILKYYQPVSLDELIKGEFKDEKNFHLSFDDGLRECFDVIAPMLLKKGIPATFFVNPAFIGNKKLFHRYKASLLISHIVGREEEAVSVLKKWNITQSDIFKFTWQQADMLDSIAKDMDLDFEAFLNERQPYLTKEQLVELGKQGFSVGAHSWSHPEFWLITEEEQVAQVEKSVGWVRDNINPQHLVFSFPFTDSGCSEKVFRAIAGKNLCRLTFGTAGIKADELPFHLQRFPCETRFPLKAHLKTEMVYSKLRKFAGKNIVKHT